MSAESIAKVLSHMPTAMAAEILYLQKAPTVEEVIARQEESMFSSGNAARYLGITPRTFYEWRVSGREDIPYVMVGKRAQFRKADLDAWLQSRRVVPSGATK